MKVILPSGAIAESKNPVVVDQWKKAGYREVLPPAKPKPEPKTEPKPELKQETEPKPRRRTRKK